MILNKTDLPTVLLYHGTSIRYLPSILKEGLQPSAKTGADNWKHTVTSNKKCIYLTNTYPLYFAFCAVDVGKKDEDLLLLEVAVSQLRLQADEDAIEQSMRGKYNELPEDWDIKRRTIYYRSRAHNYSWKTSLNFLGTCGHRGGIEFAQIKRAVIVTQEKNLSLIFEGSLDPMISVDNFSIYREKYQQSVRWLFDDAPQLDCAPMMNREGIHVVQPENLEQELGLKKGEMV